MGLFDWLDPPKKKRAAAKRTHSKLRENDDVAWRDWVPTRHRLDKHGNVIPATARGTVIKAKGRPRRLLVEWDWPGRVRGQIAEGWYDPEMLKFRE